MQRRTAIAHLLQLAGGLLASLWVGTAATAKEPHGSCERGYGPCKYRTCSCYAFDGKGLTCKCGHSFYDHVR